MRTWDKDNRLYNVYSDGFKAFLKLCNMWVLKTVQGHIMLYGRSQEQGCRSQAQWNFSRHRTQALNE